MTKASGPSFGFGDFGYIFYNTKINLLILGNYHLSNSFPILYQIVFFTPID